MKKFVFGAAIVAASAFASPSFALTDAELEAMLADISLQCGATTTLEQCDALVQAKIAQLESDGAIDDSQRASALAKIVESATGALNRSAGSNAQIGAEIEQIVGRVSTQLATIKTRSPAAAAAVNSVVSRVTVAVLVVVQEKNLTSNAITAGNVGNALTSLANQSSDNTQKAAVTQIASVLRTGGSIVDVINEIETVNSFASPA